MIGLVYLAWAPLGAAPLQGFLRSYHSHSAGAEHRLVVLLNGLGLPAANERITPLNVESLRSNLAGTEHTLIVLERPLIDLAAYEQAARELTDTRLCFMNSYSEILCDDWLMKLRWAADLPNVGLVGATGSWESKSRLVSGDLSHWSFQLAMLPVMRHHYPSFPNPHVRTTTFMMDRELVLQMGLRRAFDKPSAYLLESGRHGITRQVQGRGLSALVVGRDGHVYGPRTWPCSRTFRSGEQSNLLVADNRTRQWELASRRIQRKLTRYAWGRQACSEPAGRR